MYSAEIDYLTYPIVIVNPDREALSWLAELKKDFLFHVVSEVQEYEKILTGQSSIAAIIFDQVDQDEEFLTLTRVRSPHLKTYALVSPGQSDHLKNLIPANLSCQPLVKPCQPEILRLELGRSIERQAWKRGQELLLAVQRQESWFSLIGQLTREWAHEIRNRAAIISLNAEISMTKVRKPTSKPLNPASTMEKIIDQCLKISKTLDNVRELSNLGQTRFSPTSLMEVINQVMFLMSLEAPQLPIQVERREAADPSASLAVSLALSLGESARLRSALLGILRYFRRIKDGSSPVSILIDDHEGFCLRVQTKDALSEAIPTDFSFIDGPLHDLLSAEPDMMDFALGIRLLKSFGSEVTIEKDGSGREITLVINLPNDCKQRPLFNNE
ncbi:MAG: hypothetical protein AB1611_09195 [bacterium]